MIGNPITWFSLLNLIIPIKLLSAFFMFYKFHWGATQLSYQTRVNPMGSRDYPLFHTTLTVFDSWFSNAISRDSSLYSLLEGEYGF